MRGLKLRSQLEILSLDSRRFSGVDLPQTVYIVLPIQRKETDERIILYVYSSIHKYTCYLKQTYIGIIFIEISLSVREISWPQSKCHCRLCVLYALHQENSQYSIIAFSLLFAQVKYQWLFVPEEVQLKLHFLFCQIFPDLSFVFDSIIFFCVDIDPILIFISISPWVLCRLTP